MLENISNSNSSHNQDSFDWYCNISSEFLAEVIFREKL